jgi:hypothetical protein
MVNQEEEFSIVGGVRQEDPLSPMLFLVVIKPLHKLIAKAQEQKLLRDLNKKCDSFRISLYADDATLFIMPHEKDFTITSEILSIFANASGLQTNVSKTEIFPICCDISNLDHLHTSGMVVSSFPCKYLGLPLHYMRPTKLMLQPVVQKIIDRLLGRKRRFFSYPRRELLVKSVLIAMPTYFLMIHKLKKWAITRINRFIRGFLWKGHNPENVRGGHCLVN